MITCYRCNAVVSRETDEDAGRILCPPCHEIVKAELAERLSHATETGGGPHPDGKNETIIGGGHIVPTGKDGRVVRKGNSMS